MKEYIEREAAVAAAQAIVDAVQIDPDWERETRKEYLGEKRGAKAVQDVLRALPAAPVDALVKAARDYRDALEAYNALPPTREADYEAYAAALLRYKTAHNALLNTALAALDGEPQ